MKKYCMILVLLLGMSTAAYAGHVSELTIGGSTASDIDDKAGLLTSFTFWNEFNYMFALGFNPSMVWFNWNEFVYNENGEKETETVTIGGDTQEQPLKDSANAFLFPLMIDAKIQYPVTEMFIPYLAGGMGYSIMPLVYENEQNVTYGGFSWQVHGGLAIEVPDIPDFRFIGDVKYRHASLKNDDKVEIDMSGWSFSAGVQYGAVMKKGVSNSNSSGIMW